MHHLKMTDSSLSIHVEGKSQFSSTLPVCFLDQYLNSDSMTCDQCPLGSYGLTLQQQECISCAYLNGGTEVLEAPHLFEKLQFLCDHKIGQISSADKGVYAASAYPSQR